MGCLAQGQEDSEQSAALPVLKRADINIDGIIVSGEQGG